MFKYLCCRLNTRGGCWSILWVCSYQSYLRTIVPIPYNNYKWRFYQTLILPPPIWYPPTACFFLLLFLLSLYLLLYSRFVHWCTSNSWCTPNGPLPRWRIRPIDRLVRGEAGGAWPYSSRPQHKGSRGSNRSRLSHPLQEFLSSEYAQFLGYTLCDREHDVELASDSISRCW